MSQRGLASTSNFIKFGQIARQVNVSSKPVSLVKHTGVIPGGFPYSAYNGDATLKPEAILSGIESTRGVLFNRTPFSDQSFLDFEKIYNENFIFIIASTMEVNPRLYDKQLCKSSFQFDVELDHVGKTSFQLQTRFFLEALQDPVVTSHISSVFVSSKTRQPTSPPVWWREKFVPHIPKGGKAIGKLNLSGGDKSQMTESQFRVSLSDVDSYQHTNWTQYVKYCHNAFGQHRVSKIGKDGYQEYLGRGLKNVSIVFKKESSVDDVLTVKVSPEMDSDNNDVYYFSVENESSDLICQCKLHYHPCS